MKLFSTPNFKSVLFIAVFALSTNSIFANSNPGVIPASNIEVNATEKSVNFKWTTSVQSNFNYFEVERSLDNANFKTVGMVMDGFETLNAQKAFMFKDQKSALKGQQTVYYRMKQINNDGTVEYSETITVKL